MRKKIISMLLVSVMAISLAACGSEEEVAEEELSETAEEEETVEEADPYAQFDEVSTDGKVLSYLTGEWVDEEVGRTRPLAIMIENTKACLPQYGVSQASIIYECPAEGGITRMMAIFDDYSGLDRIGNTRSSRPYYVYLASEYDAIYAHAGGNPAAFELIDGGLVENINGLDGDVGNYFFRSSDAQAPHNLYTSSDGLDSAIELRGYDTSYPADYEPHFIFSTESTNELSDGETCEALQLYFFDNEPYFIYNSEDNLYYRYEFGSKQIDANTSEQLAVTNIILQYASWFDYTGSQYIGFDLPNNSGTGKYITNGKMVDITWSKEGDSDVTHYYYNGEEIQLNPGKTWISLCQDTYADQNEFYASESDLNN